jgi:CRISPR/Cas system-associated endonuclease Cas1
LAQFAEDPRAPAGFDADVRLADRVLSSLEKEFRKPVAAAGFNPEASAGLFRGREGTASRLYFNQLAKILAGRFGNVINVINVIGVINVINSNDVNDPNDPNDVNDVNDSNDPNDPNDSNDPNDPINFTSRQKRPAYDPFNVLLNYLYGMLYTAVHLSLLKSGLDPYMGILHADRYGATPTLVFDAIEPYRPWADVVALRLALDGEVGPESFEQREDPTEGLWLSGVGKGVVIDRMLAFLEESAPMAGQTRKIKRRVQMDMRAQQLAVGLKEIGH